MVAIVAPTVPQWRDSRTGAADMITAKNIKEKSQMYYIVDTEKTFDQASADLNASAKRHGFGVLHIHNLGATLRSKGVSFEEECKVFEVCNPKQASKVLSTDMRLNMALPCRISVFTEGGKTRIGLIRPATSGSSKWTNCFSMKINKQLSHGSPADRGQNQTL